MIVAIHNYMNHSERSQDDLEFQKGEELELIEETSAHWWKARNSNGVIGLVPSSFVQKTVSATRRNTIHRLRCCTGRAGGRR